MRGSRGGAGKYAPVREDPAEETQVFAKNPAPAFGMRQASAVYHPERCDWASISLMGTKQHKTFCAACGKTANHVTVY